MPTTPIRGLGEVGIITDKEPQDLPLKAWTSGRNVRFSDGVISRYPVFKKLSAAYSYTKTPTGVIEGGGNTGQGWIVTTFSDGSMEQFYNAITTDVTPLGTLGVTAKQTTSTFLGGVTYVNRETDTPVYRATPADINFTAIPNWTAGDHCNSLRAFKDFLIAINVTKSSVSYPAMYKWSDATQAGVPPARWNPADIGTLAGENVLNDLRGQLIDGRALSGAFMLYGEHQTYRMDYIGEPLIFRADPLFQDQGVIALNCVEEFEGKHYVFGGTDLYMHDGMQKVSIAEGRVKETVFSEIDYNLKGRCFTYHDVANSEIAFCYPTNSETAKWKLDDIAGCNRAAVHNYKYNTWTFVDMPSVVSWCSTVYESSLTWADMANWGDEETAWAAFDSTKRSNILLASTGNTALSITAQSYFLDDLSDGGLTNPLATNILWDAYVIGLYKDLDDLGADIAGRKLCRSLIPQISSSSIDDIVKITVGRSTGLTADVVWGPTMDFKPWTDYKYDMRVNDRYLAYKFELQGTVDAVISGYDVDIMLIAGR